jgi:mannose-6-phosphate isomerase-like protein (cupin superfamily)
MTETPTQPAFHFPQVLQSKPGTIFRRQEIPSLTRPEGFRIPDIYFSWAVLEGDRSTHHHPDNDELLLVLSGQGSIRLVGPGKPGNRFDQTFEVSSGDVVLFPQGWSHSVASSQEDSLRVLVIFNHPAFVATETEEKKEAMYLGENA